LSQVYLSHGSFLIIWNNLYLLNIVSFVACNLNILTPVDYIENCSSYKM